MLDTELLALAKKVNTRLVIAGRMIVTAESCTGGLVASALTGVPGSSAAVFGGFITYANAAKSGMIGVPAALIDAHGAVSEPVARAMAEGALGVTGTDIAVSTTGIAGPGGGTEHKPVGLVHFGLATADGTTHRVEHFGDLGRDVIRREAVRVALEMVLASFPENGSYRA